MFGYTKIVTPEGKTVKVAKTLYEKISRKIAYEQCYEFYIKFLVFLGSVPTRVVANYARAIYEKVDADNFLYLLNVCTDKDGNVDWNYFFHDLKTS